MYLDCFDLAHRPFAITPDLDFTYWSENYRRAFDTIKVELLRNAPVTVLIGKTGAGKTLLTNALSNDPDILRSHQILLMTNMLGNAADIRQRLMVAIGKSATSVPAEIEIARGLDEIRMAGKTPLIIADEAQNLSSEGSEVLGLISDGSSSGPVPILLAGQAELGGLLRQLGYQTLRKQIGETVQLRDLPVGEIEAYIRTRLTRAGAKTDLFTADAAQYIHKKAGGIPRLINKLCEALLFLAAQEDLRVIDHPAAQRLFHQCIDPITLALRLGTVERVTLPEPGEVVSAPVSPFKEKVEVPRVLRQARAHPVEASPLALNDPVVPARAPRRRLVVAGFFGCLTAVIVFLNPWVQTLLTTGLPIRPTPENVATVPELAPDQDVVAVTEAQPVGELAAEALEPSPEPAPQPVQGLSGTAPLPADGTSPAPPSNARTEPLPKTPPDAAKLTVGTSSEPDTSTAEPQPTTNSEAKDLSDLVKPVAANPAPEAEDYFQDALNSVDTRDMAVLYTRAALRGHERAARYLAQMFETGDGVVYAPSVAARWHSLADGEGILDGTSTPQPETAPNPLFSHMNSEEIELIWEGEGPEFMVEIASDTGQILGRFDTSLTAARLRPPDSAAVWRVTSLGAAPSDWQIIEVGTQR